jgi:VanZ family protein
MPIAYAATIFMLSAVSAPPPTGWIRLSDKFLHFGAFGLMAVLVALAVQRPGHPLTLKRAILAIIITSAYGVLDELHQSLVPDRVPSTGDALADAMGAILGVAWYCLIARKWRCFSFVMGTQQ